VQIPFYSLRTGILAHLAFLIVSAMLLINVVMVKFSERDLVQAKINTGRLLLHTLAHKVEYQLTNGQKKWADLGSDPQLERDISQLLQVGGVSEALVVNREGMRTFTTGSWGGAVNEALSISREALATGKWSLDFRGSTWGVIWLAHERVNMSIPLVSQGHLMGAVTIRAHLGPLYETLRRSEKFILIFILLNTVILLLFGISLLSRTVVGPIHKLLSITEEFKEGEAFPNLEGGASRNEIGQLFRSLNMMINRLDENKKELKDHISSLEKANQEIKKAQYEIIKSEKLASVGRLATGVAHEIGNPIGIVLGYLELLKGEDLNEEEQRDFLCRIESEITRVSQIIRQLLDFSRPASIEPRPINIHDLVMETINMLSPHPMMSSIEIRSDLKAAKDTVWTDPSQIKQVFVNIIMNAADAMGKTDILEDAAAVRRLTIKSINSGDSIELSFTDTGSGIPEHELGHIFDPFYTTKEPGKGTGLGLSICYRIIEGLGGHIHAKSSQGRGTAIIIKIPLFRTQEEGQRSEEAVSGSRRPSRGQSLSKVEVGHGSTTSPNC
jgi:two-component system NtrC family sensor kinase